MFKNMKLGMKISLGFTILIMIACLLGSLAVYNMKRVEIESNKLAQEYVPEVKFANNVERYSLLTMYGMRGYSLSENEEYLNQGLKNLDETKKWLDKCQTLADESKHLVKLKDAVGVCRKEINNYGELANETVKCIQSIDAYRTQLDDSAAFYMKSCVIFLGGQNQAFETDLAECQDKIRLATEVVDLGTNVRVLNFKAQSQKNCQLIREAADKLNELNQSTDALKKITRDTEDLRCIDNTEQAAKAYQFAILQYAKEFEKGPDANQTDLAHYLSQMDTAAGTYVSNCTEFLSGQQEKLQTDMNERHEKITLVNDVIDVGNATRIACFKSQSLRNPQIIKDAQSNFDVMDTIFGKLKKITRRAEDLNGIANIRTASSNYKQAMLGLLDNWLKLEDLNQKRGKAAGNVLAAVQETADAGISQTNEIAQSAASALSLSSMVMTVGLGVALIVGIALAFFITISITKPVNRIIAGLTEGAEQVASASGQVSSASQALAEGATEQAAGLEETSSSLEEMSSMTKQNADNASQANALASEASNSARNGSEAMSRMSDAINDIQKSSDETAKIIKVIDEIAFQTNLLALNAAVEAARAGEAGKGFAVVAEEVRNLAMRSAEAAKDTSNLIEESVKNSKNGVEISIEVGKVLEEIVTSVSKTTDLVGEIAAASQEQAQGIDQVNTAVSQMDKVTQQNAANAEESASASEELSGQAEEMNFIVNELTALVRGNKNVQLQPSLTSRQKQKSKTLSSQDHVFHQIAADNKKPVDKNNKATAATAIPFDSENTDFSTFNG